MTGPVAFEVRFVKVVQHKSSLVGVKATFDIIQRGELRTLVTRYRLQLGRYRSQELVVRRRKPLSLWGGDLPVYAGRLEVGIDQREAWSVDLNARR